MLKNKKIFSQILYNRWLLCQRLLFVFICFFAKISLGQINATFVVIPKNKYTVGKKGHLANPLRQIVLDSFCISTTEVTNQQFEAFVLATNYKTDAEKHYNAMVFEPGLKEYRWLEDSTAYWRYPNGITRGTIFQKMNHPVTCISYRDAIAYCKWAKVRLPTLDEWEVASRVNSSAYFFWGNQRDSLPKYANVWHGKNHLEADSSDGYIYTSPVAKYAPNAWGLYDVYGNVFEFCTGKLPKYKNKKNIVHARGGSWWCSQSSCNFFTSVDIGRVAINASFSNQGFRVVK
jgi:formylglycine-generating enzyme